MIWSRTDYRSRRHSTQRYPCFMKRPPESASFRPRMRHGRGDGEVGSTTPLMTFGITLRSRWRPHKEDHGHQALDLGRMRNWPVTSLGEIPDVPSQNDQN